MFLAWGRPAAGGVVTTRAPAVTCGTFEPVPTVTRSEE